MNMNNMYINNMNNICMNNMNNMNMNNMSNMNNMNMYNMDMNNMNNIYMNNMNNMNNMNMNNIHSNQFQLNSQENNIPKRNIFLLFTLSKFDNRQIFADVSSNMKFSDVINELKGNYNWLVTDHKTKFSCNGRTINLNQTVKENVLKHNDNITIS